MNKTFKIYETPVILFLQVMIIMIISDILFFSMLKLVDFAHRDSLVINVLTAKEELIGVVMIFQVFTINYLFFSWIFSYYWFDNNILLHKKGIIFTSTREFILSEVEGAIRSQGFWGKIFNYGTIKLIFANTEVLLNRIPNPENFVRIVNSKKLK